MISLKWQLRFMDEAKARASWSKDPSTRVGCVAVNPERKTVIGSGFNGFPRGIEDRLVCLLLDYQYVLNALLD